MQYRPLGKTGMEVSAVSFGGIKLGGLPQDQVTELIRIAHERGMNYIDTARCYGQSEVKLGIALEKLGLRDKFYLSSKVIRRGLGQFKEDFETTMQNLRTDYLNILFVHDVSTPDIWEEVSSNGVLAYMQELKKKGRIGHLALSTHDTGIGKTALETGLFEVAMLAYNPSNLEVESEVLPLCREKGIGTVIMKPLGGGVLSEARSAQLGFSVTAEECLRFAVTGPGVDVVIPGLDKPEYVHAAADAGDSCSMTEDERSALIQRVDIKAKHYCRGCGYCLPCPQDIPIPTVLGLYNRWEVFGGVDWAQMHQITHEYTLKVDSQRGPSHCIACGECTTRCPFNLPVPELMAKAAKTLRRY